MNLQAAHEGSAAVQMAKALQHMHSRGVVHGDLKPDNIFTAAEGVFKLGDFGLARPLSPCQEGVHLEEGDSRSAWPKHAIDLSMAYI